MIQITKLNGSKTSKILLLNLLLNPRRGRFRSNETGLVAGRLLLFKTRYSPHIVAIKYRFSSNSSRGSGEMKNSGILRSIERGVATFATKLITPARNGPTLTDGPPRKAGLELANALQKKLGPLDILVNDLNKTRTRVEARRFSPLDCPVNARQGDDQGHRR